MLCQMWNICDVIQLNSLQELDTAIKDYRFDSWNWDLEICKSFDLSSRIDFVQLSSVLTV